MSGEIRRHSLRGRCSCRKTTKSRARLERVEQLRLAIRQGSYRIDLPQLAEILSRYV